MDYLKDKSIIFAPMEGITDDIFRSVITKTYPEWDFLCCDFLRVPNAGVFTNNYLIKHFGQDCYLDESLKNKTIYQFLASENSLIEHTVSQLHQLNFKWIDLNLGCPSKTVVSHKGGSYLLTDMELLKSILKRIKSNFPFYFTCKMRLGFKNTDYFLDIIKLLNDVGVNAITIHARTRDQLYTGVADWNFIEKAVTVSKVPIIGNGDIWNLADAKNIYTKTNCHSIMIARGALFKPWLAKEIVLNRELNSEEIKNEIYNYFFNFIDVMINRELKEETILKRVKSISRYIFSNLENGTQIRTNVMRSANLVECQNILRDIRI